MKTLQDIYNEVATKMIKQGEPATKNYQTTRCSYINPSGKKCAVGCLFNDEDAAMIEEKWGGKGCTLFIDFIIEKLKLEHIDKDCLSRLLLDLQECHDQTPHSTKSRWNEYWYQRMDLIAKTHGLDSSILQQGVA